MNRAAVAFAAACLLTGTAVQSATPETGLPVGQKRSTAEFWAFAECVLAEARDESLSFLDAPTFDKAEGLAQTQAGCLHAGRSTMRFDAVLFRGALAGAYLKQRYENAAALPDYSQVRPIYRLANLEEKTSRASRVRHLLLASSECVVQADPANVLALMRAEPFSEDETRAFGELMPYLGQCMPVDEGEKLSFSRATLRGLLSEALYEIDKCAASRAVPDPSDEIAFAVDAAPEEAQQ